MTTLPPPPPPPPPIAPPVPREAVPAVIVNDVSNYLFTLTELAEMYGMSYQGAKKAIAGVEPDGIRPKGKAKVWHISRVSKLSKDVELSIQREFDSSKRNDMSIAEIQTADTPLPTENLGAMTPAQLKTFYQTISIQQEYLKKKRDNMKDANQLIPVEKVRDAFVSVFKIIGIFFDTLPDVLERDGIVDRGQIDKAVHIIDIARDELAENVEARLIEFEVDT